ncbi:MAG: hypothetical protein GQ533_10950 [Methanosarcinaceae archaeon]|nr:hypothetical protein [Methanosarcinaceae archaeon]
MSKIYPTNSHPEGNPSISWFEIRGNKIYPTNSHPEGNPSIPWYEIRD